MISQYEPHKSDNFTPSIYFQYCYIEMAVGTESMDTVHLVPDQMLMKQKLDMHMFEITLWNLDYNDNQNGLRVLIVLKRKFVSEIMTTYFPSFLLLAITFATTFFKPFFFECQPDNDAGDDNHLHQ